MKHCRVLRLSARETPHTAIVEPWAEELQVAPGQECRVVALHPSAPPSFDVELHRGALVVSVLLLSARGRTPAPCGRRINAV